MRETVYGGLMHETNDASKGRVDETAGGRLYTVPEAMAELRLSRAQIFRLLGSGELGSEKNGGRRLIPSEAIQAFRRPGAKPTVYTSARAAQLLLVTEAWLIEQADADSVPHTRLGDGAIRFTEQHIAEILATAERRPSAPLKTA